MGEESKEGASHEDGVFACVAGKHRNATQLAAVQERWTLKLVLLVDPYRQVARRQVEDK